MGQGSPSSRGDGSRLGIPWVHAGCDLTLPRTKARSHLPCMHPAHAGVNILSNNKNTWWCLAKCIIGVQLFSGRAFPFVRVFTTQDLGHLRSLNSNLERKISWSSNAFTVAHHRAHACSQANATLETAAAPARWHALGRQWDRYQKSTRVIAQSPVPPLCVCWTHGTPRAHEDPYVTSEQVNKRQRTRRESLCRQLRGTCVSLLVRFWGP